MGFWNFWVQLAALYRYIVFLLKRVDKVLKKVNPLLRHENHFFLNLLYHVSTNIVLLKTFAFTWFFETKAFQFWGFCLFKVVDRFELFVEPPRFDQKLILKQIFLEKWGWNQFILGVLMNA